MAISVIPLRLDSDIEFERRMRTLYDSKPRARRQEWLRQVLQMGLAAVEGGLVPAAAVASANAPEPVAAPRPAQQGAVPAARLESAPIAVVPAVAGEPESASALLGFFGSGDESPAKP
jgi:hypothetical protein